MLGDLHGNYKGLVQVLEKVCFNDEIDCLYFVGDLADGPQNVECLKRLMKIKNLFPCWGNHDIRLRDYLDGKNNIRWETTCGRSSILEFGGHEQEVDMLQQYFEKCRFYYLTKNELICHAGFNEHKNIDCQKSTIYYNTRDTFKKAVQLTKPLPILIKNKPEYRNIFIGHSVTKSTGPEIYRNIYCIDTGSSKKGRLCLMDMDSKEYWLSDFTEKLYK